MRCTVCGHNVPDFVWPQLVTTTPGGHFVIVDTPITLRHEQRPGDYDANVYRVIAEATVRFELCRDLHPELAALRDAQHGDPMRAVPDTPDVIRQQARWIDQGFVLDAFPPRRGLPTQDDLDRAHEQVMADADLLLGRDVDTIRAKNRAALVEEEVRAGEILRANRPLPVTTAPRGSRVGRWLRGILP